MFPLGSVPGHDDHLVVPVVAQPVPHLDAVEGEVPEEADGREEALVGAQA